MTFEPPHQINVTSIHQFQTPCFKVIWIKIIHHKHHTKTCTTQVAKMLPYVDYHKFQKNGQNLEIKQSKPLIPTIPLSFKSLSKPSASEN